MKQSTSFTPETCQMAVHCCTRHVERIKVFVFLSTIMLLLTASKASSQSLFDGIHFSGQFFLTYEWVDEAGNHHNEFRLERGYITFRKNISPKIGIRFTQDVTIDQEGDGEGDIELRLKYAFVHYNFEDWGIFRDPVIEFGVVRRPWTDFEQRVNDYRMQGSMFLDREKIAPSADYGVTVAGNLGPRLENATELNLDRSTSGRYGSFAFGIYNGGGYAELEKNSNKLIEGRVTFRPFWNSLPGLQISYAGARGKGNLPESPAFEMHLGYLSFSSTYAVIATQYYYGTGDVLGRRLDARGSGLPMDGYSAFAEVMPFKFPLSLVVRGDILNDRLRNSMLRKRGLAGLAWKFENGSKIMIDLEREESFPVPGMKRSTNRWELATEIRF